MPRYYRLSPAIWNEPWDDEMRLLAVYVLTSPHRSTEGLFKLPPPYIQADLGWKPLKIDKVMGRLEEQDFLRRDGEVVLVVNALKYQAPQNENQVTAALRALEGVPPSVLDEQFAGLAERFSERLAQGLVDGFPERFGNALSLTPTPSLPPSLSQDEGFEAFWKIYPTRNGTKGSKKNAQVAWERLKPDKRALALEALPFYEAAADGYPKDAERYLKHEIWEGIDPELAGKRKPQTRDRFVEMGKSLNDRIQQLGGDNDGQTGSGADQISRGLPSGERH